MFSQFYIQQLDYSILLKARLCMIINLSGGKRQLEEHNSKIKRENFSPPLGFELQSPGTVNQFATHELN